MGKSIRNKISESLDMPKEVILNIPHIKILGDEEIEIENHKGIIEYTYNFVRLNSSIGIIKITGEGFIIKEINPDSIFLKGKILSVEFIK